MSNQLLILAPVILAYLPLPEYNVYLMKTINRDTQEYEKFEEMMEGYLLGILPSLRYPKLLDLIYNTYQVEAFKLCVRLFTNAPLDVWLADQNKAIFMGRIYAEAVLHTLQSKDTTQIDLESLPKASAFMDQIRREYIFFQKHPF